MWLDLDLYIQIAAWPSLLSGFTLTRQANAITVIYTCRHFDRQGFMFLCAALSMTVRTRVCNGFALAAAIRACLLNGEKPLLHAYLADTATG